MPTQLNYVTHFRDLEVYKKQRALRRDIVVISRKFPADEKYSLTDQVRRSSRSIGAQIAEAWAKRLYPKHFISKLTDADGEQLETQHWLIDACDCRYIQEPELSRLTAKCEEIGKMLGSMMRKAESFASSDYTLRDDSSPYLVDEPAASEH